MDRQCSTGSTGSTGSNDIVAYTIILGNYDFHVPLNPAYSEAHIDYYFITDNKTKQVPGYEMIYVESTPETQDQIYAYYKNKMPDIIRKYKYSIYFDGNAEVNNKLSGILDYVQVDDIAIMQNQYALGKPCNKHYLIIYNRFLKDGWIDSHINVNTKFVIRKHSDAIMQFCDSWYEESYPVRADELSLLYCVWKHNLKLYKIVNYLNVVYYFAVHLHRSSKNGGRKRYSWFQYFFYKLMTCSSAFFYMVGMMIIIYNIYLNDLSVNSIESDSDFKLDI
jgi:hypothetical protein